MKMMKKVSQVSRIRDDPIALTFLMTDRPARDETRVTSSRIALQSLSHGNRSEVGRCTAHAHAEPRPRFGDSSPRASFGQWRRATPSPLGQ